MKAVVMGPVEKYLSEKVRREGAAHLTLIDPEKANLETVEEICLEAEGGGTAAILLGGSTVASSQQVDLVAERVKRSVKIPVILFPGNISGIGRHADAVFFMSLLNSANPYYLIDAQALGAPWVKRFGVEPIPLGYIIMGSGGTAGFIGYARPIPYEKGELAAAYALAAQYLGMRFVYLEAGSGAQNSIPPETISAVRKTVSIPLIVGGGIRTSGGARKAVKAGANIIVTGTVVEKTRRVREKIRELVSGIKA